MIPLIDFSKDSGYKVGAFIQGLLCHNGRNQVVGWGLCLGKSGPCFKCGLLRYKKKLMAISVRPLSKASVRAAAWHRGGNFSVLPLLL